MTLTRYRPTPWWWSVKIETCRSTFKYFNVFYHWNKHFRLIQFWMWKSACVGVYQLLNWKIHGETLKFYRKILYARCISLSRNNWQSSDHTVQYEDSRYVIFSVQLQLSLLQSTLPELFPYFLFSLCNLSLLFLNNPLKSSGYYIYHVLPTQFTCVLLGSQRNSYFFLIIFY